VLGFIQPASSPSTVDGDEMMYRFGWARRIPSAVMCVEGTNSAALHFFFQSALERRNAMNMRIGVPLVVAAMSLSACGYSTGDRALSGAGIGAAGGAVAGALVGAPLAGAAIGAGAGAATGEVTSPSAVNLGKPVWER
jgi:osmotically inducible lipoprotein OsmB